LHFKVCGMCAFYAKASTPEQVTEMFDSHSCKRRHPMSGMKPTMHPLEEASWVMASLKKRGGMVVA